MTARPHDALFKSAFEDPANAAALLRGLLPAAIRDVIAWDTLAPEPGSFVDPALADRHSDLLFSATLHTADPAVTFFLLEHMFRVVDPMHHDQLHAKVRQLGTHAEEIAMTIAEMWLEQGREEGLAKGHKEGLAKGHKEGQIAALRSQLAFKFGSPTLDRRYEALLHAAMPDTIDRYLQRVLRADSLAAVFED